VLTKNISLNPAPVTAVKLVIVNLSTLAQSPQLYLPYDKDISNSKTIGIRVITPNTPSIPLGGTLIVLPDGGQLAPTPFITNITLTLCSPGHTPDSYIKDIPVIRLMGARLSKPTPNTGILFNVQQQVTQQFNRQIDPGNSYIQQTVPFGNYNNLFLALAWYYEPIKFNWN
jgi:hypothetical protein